jgi:ABC-type molybdenum transport system ATPase subunit/photorepair protein PhrA
MDALTIRRVHDWLTRELTIDQTLLVVVHDVGELPANITHTLRFQNGRVEV